MSASDIKKGIVTSYGIFVADLLAGVLFTPFLIRSLGQSEYGVFSLIGAFIASLAILDFGFGNAITRYVAEYRTSHSKDKETHFMAMCLLMYGVIALLTLGAGAGLYSMLDFIYGVKLSPHELQTAKSMFLILMVNVTFSFFIGAFNAYIQGYEKYSVINGITFYRLLLRIAVLSVLLTMGYKALMVVMVDTALNLLTGLGFYLFARLKLGLRVKMLYFDRKLLKEITRYSSLVFVGSISEMLFWRIGLLVLGAMSGAEAVAVYAVGMTLISYFQYVSGVINGKLFPRVTQMVVQGAGSSELTAFCSRVGRIQFMLLGAVVSGFLLFGRQFIELWIGPDYKLSWEIGTIFMTVMLVQVLQYPCVMILRAMKKDGQRTLYQLVLIVIGTLLGIALAGPFGMLGMTAGLASAIVLLNWVVVNVHYTRVFGYGAASFWKQIGRLVPAMAAAYATGILIHLIPGHSWSNLLLKGLSFSVSYAIWMWLFGANASEKALLLRMRRGLRPGVESTGQV
ncbi:oligosaccharide flippase family protein [Paenibacillus gansuensis]|uniref:Oligosaccharide flippase family protein n=1 Tax=Paenibacillus gansuensis TaxID=306542 RepID=A0ABW5PF72_9BACL